MKSLIQNYKAYMILLSMMLACSVSYLDKSYGQGHVKITYDVSAPLGNTMDFVGETSFRGFSFEAGMNLNDNFALGIKSGLHSFYESLNKDTYTDNNVTIYGKQFRYINSIPILLTASYFSGRMLVFLHI
ncbi:MAG: hypothetical protein HC830_03400 [Bacteroidetes bacterium]|nr:hypothetical protein [Bacteroidota bacterium]